jgi:hypothetical protein
MAPIVTGDVKPAALEDLIRLCAQLDKLRDPEATVLAGGCRRCLSRESDLQMSAALITVWLWRTSR